MQTPSPGAFDEPVNLTLLCGNDKHSQQELRSDWKEKAKERKKERDMDVASRRIATALKTAIRREERTADAYQVQAKKARDPGAKKVLESLVRQEMEHAKKLKLVLDKGIDSSILGKRGKHLVEGLHVVNDDVRDVEKGGEVARVLTRAIKAEQNSSALYRSLEKIYKGVDIEELFGKLAEEEDLHKARLERMLARL